MLLGIVLPGPAVDLEGTMASLVERETVMRLPRLLGTCLIELVAVMLGGWRESSQRGALWWVTFLGPVDSQFVGNSWLAEQQRRRAHVDAVVS